MKLQVTILLFCITMAVARPNPPRDQSPGQGGSGRANNLQDGLRSLQLNTLLSTIEGAGLVEALSGDSDLTLFAPTDAAIDTFMKSLPSAPDGEAVKTVLLNHVIAGKAVAADISDGLTVKNLAGNDMTFRVTNSGVTIGGARVARTDIPVRRVTVHVLDDVINPANLPGRR